MRNFEEISGGKLLSSAMSLTHTQQVQRLYRSALRTAFDWAYHRHCNPPLQRYTAVAFDRFICREIFMAEATRIRGMFEASRFASSVVNTRIIGRVPLFSCPPPGTPLTDRLCSRPEPFILRSTLLFGPLRCIFRSPISDIVRQISTCGPLSQ